MNYFIYIAPIGLIIASLGIVHYYKKKEMFWVFVGLMGMFCWTAIIYQAILK